MREFIAIAVAFGLLPILSKKLKTGFGPILLIVGTVLGLVAGLPLITLGTSFVQVFTVASTIQIIIVVVAVGILGNLLKHYGFMNKIVESLQQLIPNKKALIMILPATIGLLTVPGGAFLSAPFVDELGKDMDMAPERRAVVNLSFRHISAFVLPFSNTMLFVATIMPDINIYQLIGLNLGFVFIMQFTAYLMYIRPAKSARAEASGDKGTAAIDVALYLSPVYMPMVFNALLGIPMYFATSLCIVWLLFLCENPRKGIAYSLALLAGAGAVTMLLPAGMLFYGYLGLIAAGLAVGLLRCKSREEYVRVGLKGVNFSTIFMLVGVYFVQNIVKNLDQVMTMFQTLFMNSSGIMVLLIVAAAALLFGVTTGLSYLPIGILLPMVSALPISMNMKLVYTAFVYSWSFLGYYYSPLHLCQLLTIKYLDCPTSKVYKEHLKVIPVVALGTFVLFYLYRFLLV